MTDLHDVSSLPQADVLIDRFGGIRPMAAKLGVPVTTVQGWKKRNAIPGTRRDDILTAANQHNIAVLDILSPLQDDKNQKTSANNRGANVSTVTPQGFMPRVVTSSTSSQSFVTGAAVAACVVLLGFIGAGLMTLGPKIEELSTADQRLDMLETQIAETQQQQATWQSILPADVATQIKSLQESAQQVQTNIQALTTDLQGMSQGALPQRLAKMEELVGKYMQNSGNTALTGFWARLQTLRGDTAQQEMLGRIMQLMDTNLPKGQVAVIGGDPSAPAQVMTAQPDVSKDLAALRAQNPDMQAAFADVPDSDLKAAALLVGFSSLRDALNRDNTSFAKDLAVMDRLVGDDDPALKMALARLAPQAEKGVLTPAGLSNSFRSVAGDVVVASLSGEDVSVHDKAKAALHNVLRIEKDGQPLTGTATQLAVAQAQKQLDQGDVTGAIATLETVNGPAAEPLAPFLAQARATETAAQLQQMLTGNILTKLGAGSFAVPTLPNVAGLTSTLQNVGGAAGNMIGMGTVVEDKASNTRIYQAMPTMPALPEGMKALLPSAQPPQAPITAPAE